MYNKLTKLNMTTKLENILTKDALTVINSTCIIFSTVSW